jgi:transcriptional regulator with PAS, ATPase and Fis domain
VVIVGLATTDETLVARTGLVVRRGGGQLAVASDADAVRRLFDHCAVRLFDLSCTGLLLRPECASCPITQPPEADALVLMHGVERHACFAQASRTTYRRSELARLLDDLAGLLPTMTTSSTRDAALAIRGSTPAIHLVREQIRSVAKYAGVPVLVLGETGTGKELVAKAIHELSASENAAFVEINCAAIPEALFESELFGHEAGAYTGARGVRVGLLESAGAGTVFLDEVGELPATMQPKLLRVLESRRFRRVGGNRDLEMRARVVSATNRGLGGSHGTLRADLKYRLAGFTIVLPPLRERAADIEELADMFLHAFSKRHGIAGLALTNDAYEALRSHAWPGNVRELRTVVEHAAIVRSRPTLDAADVRFAMERLGSTVPSAPAAPRADAVRLRDIERDVIRRAFDENEQNLSRAARQLGIPRSTLRDKLRRYGVRA